MKEYTKEQLVEEFGKPIWGNPICNVEYFSGIDVFDTQIIEIRQYPAFFYKYPNGIVIEIVVGSTRLRTGIQTDSIKHFEMDDSDNLLTIFADIEGEEIEIAFSVNNEDFKDIEKSLKSNYPGLLKKFND